MAVFAPASHMKLAFGLIVVLFAAVGFSLFSGMTGYAAGEGFVGNSASGGSSSSEWQCLNVNCTSYENIGWEQWAQQNCANQQSGDTVVAVCPITVNGRTVSVPLETLMADSSVQPQACAEYTCTKEVLVRDASYVVS